MIHGRCTCCKIQLNCDKNDKFVWRSIFNFIATYGAVTELDILFFENYSTEKEAVINSRCGEENLNFHPFLKRSKRSNFRDKFNLLLRRIDCYFLCLFCCLETF